MNDTATPKTNSVESFLARFKPPKNYERSILLDAMRGFAIVLMVIFHFCYDLTLFGLAEIPIYTSPGWVYFRFIILSSFLGSVGASLYLHYLRGINYTAFMRRIALITLNAWVITAVTYLTLKEMYVFFGILHLIALSSVFALAFMRLYWINLFLGLGILYLGYNYSNGFFETYGLRWIGMLPSATGSSDFTPIFPFFGLVLLGIFTARLLGDGIYKWRWQSQNNFISSMAQWLALLGRNALIIYMIHQPILWGILYAYQYSYRLFS